MCLPWNPGFLVGNFLEHIRGMRFSQIKSSFSMPLCVTFKFCSCADFFTVQHLNSFLYLVLQAVIYHDVLASQTGLITDSEPSLLRKNSTHRTETTAVIVLITVILCISVMLLAQPDSKNYSSGRAI